MSDPLKIEDLEACVRRACPEIAGEVRLEPIASGKFNTSFFVEADGRKMVLRVAPPSDEVFLFYERDMMRQEPGIHRLLLEKTHVPVAPVVAYDDSHDRIDRDFILLERLPGRALSDVGDVAIERVMLQVGQSLRETHSLTAQKYGYLGEHKPMAPQSTWIEAFQTMWRLLMADIISVGHYSHEEADNCLGLLDRNLAAFDRPVPASLLHMDVWGQNILVDGSGNLTGLVDWDRALWGDPEIEFAVLDYCGISTTAFWEGYGGARDESHEARVRQVFYYLYELQKYIVIRQGRGNDPAAARTYKAQAQQVIKHFFG
jgi:aminoglycoside phosphotransferase (APT) family kinase protein